MLANGTMTKKDFEDMSNMTNNYLAFKKECIISWLALQEAKSENFDLLSRTATIWTSLWGSYKCCWQKMVENYKKWWM